jgi:hypothetical protein
LKGSRSSWASLCSIPSQLHACRSSPQHPPAAAAHSSSCVTKYYMVYQHQHQ